VTDTAPGLRDIASAAGDEVDVRMEDGLSCRLARIDADVEGYDRGVFSQDRFPLLVDQLVAGHYLLLRHGEVIDDVALWNDEGVSRRDGKGVPEGTRQVVLSHQPDVRQAAEKAIVDGSGSFQRRTRSETTVPLAEEPVMSGLPPAICDCREQ
jgi:hypothetical protein